MLVSASLLWTWMWICCWMLQLLTLRLAHCWPLRVSSSWHLSPLDKTTSIFSIFLACWDCMFPTQRDISFPRAFSPRNSHPLWCKKDFYLEVSKPHLWRFLFKYKQMKEPSIMFSCAFVFGTSNLASRLSSVSHMASLPWQIRIQKYPLLSLCYFCLHSREMKRGKRTISNTKVQSK